MQDVVIHKAQELPPDARQAVERVLGRSLQENKEVSIMALSPHQSPTGESRRALACQLEERMNKTAEVVRDVPDGEQEAAIEEAVDSVRSRQESSGRIAA
jgi:hypothetical protein